MINISRGTLDIGQQAPSRPKNIKKTQPEITEFRCTMCGKVYKKQKNNFPATHSPLYKTNYGFLPVCYNCLEDLFMHYKSVLGSEESAMKRICLKFDYYWGQKLWEIAYEATSSRVRAYVAKTGLLKYREKTYDDTLDEENGKTVTTIEELKEAKEEGNISIPKSVIERWGVGCFQESEYNFLEEHYKMLKRLNPNIDSNQEIFIKDLCTIKLQQMKAIKENSGKDIERFMTLYRQTFASAGLKTIQESDNSVDAPLGVNAGIIAQYTPEEFYKDKKLYQDFDGLGDYFKRFILRPLKNLVTGTTDRDDEYSVKEIDNLPTSNIGDSDE